MCLLHPSRPMKPTSWPRKCRRIRTECGFTVVYKGNPQVQCRAYSWVGWHVKLLMYTVYKYLSKLDTHISVFEDRSNHYLMLSWGSHRKWEVKLPSAVYFKSIWWQCFMQPCLLKIFHVKQSWSYICQHQFSSVVKYVCVLIISMFYP